MLMDIARFEKRVLSYIIDFIIPVLISCVILYFLSKYYNFPWITYAIIGEILMAIFYFLINTLCMLLIKGRSLGMIICKTKVASLNSDKITTRQIILRNMSLAIIPMALVNIFFMLTVHTERSIFDRISNTIVTGIY